MLVFCSWYCLFCERKFVTQNGFACHYKLKSNTNQDFVITRIAHLCCCMIWQCIKVTTRGPSKTDVSDARRLCRALILLGLALCLWSACIFCLHGTIYVVIFWSYIHWSQCFLYLLVSWAWSDGSLTWLTNHCPSVLWLWHCWLSRTTRKIVSTMMCRVGL